jgi:hypothetical protein
MREEQSLTVFPIRMLRKMFGCKRKGVKGDGRKFILRSFKTFIAHQILGRSHETHGTH